MFYIGEITYDKGDYSKKTDNHTSHYSVFQFIFINYNVEGRIVRFI
jgi:hypothetical protein